MNPMESSTNNFYNANLLPNNNANMYQMNHAPYQNLPNGQYTQNPIDNRYPAQQQQPTPPPLVIKRGLEAATKPAAFNTERLDKSHHHDNSNSGSSSDSDDSNNDSDSSSAESNADKDDKENSQRIVKPFRLNFNKVSAHFWTLIENDFIDKRSEYIHTMEVSNSNFIFSFRFISHRVTQWQVKIRLMWMNQMRVEMKRK